MRELAREQELARAVVDPEQHAVETAAASAERDRLLGSKKEKYITLRARSDVLGEKEAKTEPAVQFEPQRPEVEVPLTKAARAEQDWYAAINCDVKPTEMELRDRHMSAKKDKYASQPQTNPGADAGNAADSFSVPAASVQEASRRDAGVAAPADAQPGLPEAAQPGSPEAPSALGIEERDRLLSRKNQRYGRPSPASSDTPLLRTEAFAAPQAALPGPCAPAPKVEAVAPASCPMSERDLLLSQKRSKYGGAGVRVR